MNDRQKEFLQDFAALMVKYNMESVQIHTDEFNIPRILFKSNGCFIGFYAATSMLDLSIKFSHPISLTNSFSVYVPESYKEAEDK